MKIRDFDCGKRVLVIAEVGNNHEGSFPAAKRMVRAAAEAGADAVKFQTLQAKYFVGPGDPARLARLKSFELTYPQFAALGRLAKSLGLLFISTPLDMLSAEFLRGHVDAFKVASGDNDFYPLIAKAAASGKPLIISTGISGLDQIRKTVSFVRSRIGAAALKRRLALLHCVSSYPTPPEEANLRSIPFLARKFKGIAVGYSDHTIGIEAAVASVALGARIVEKHFTLDKNFSDFRDHRLSADPADLKLIVKRIRAVEAMLGESGKSLRPCERPSSRAFRRSAAARADLAPGHTLGAGDLMWIRPGTGLAPGREARLIGRKLRRAVKFGELLKPSDLKPR